MQHKIVSLTQHILAAKHKGSAINNSTSPKLSIYHLYSIAAVHHATTTAYSPCSIIQYNILPAQCCTRTEPDQYSKHPAQHTLGL